LPDRPAAQSYTRTQKEFTPDTRFGPEWSHINNDGTLKHFGGQTTGIDGEEGEGSSGQAGGDDTAGPAD
jgi:hypothetical protein